MIIILVTLYFWSIIASIASVSKVNKIKLNSNHDSV